MKLRRLNDSGITRFDEFRELPSPNRGNLSAILEDPDLTSVVTPDIAVAPRQFGTRFDAGEYLNDLFRDTSIPKLDEDRGIWTWLAAYYYDQLCPRETSPGARPRWVPTEDFRNYYRHLLRGPHQIYRAHHDNPQRAMALLANPLHQPGDIAEQLVSRQEVITSKAAVEVATRLYIGPNNRPKRDSATRGPGGPRRFAAVMRQLDLTWDLSSDAMTAEKLLGLLPAEFDRFKS